MTELLTVKETAAFLKVAQITLAKWRAKRTGPNWTKTGRSVRYPRRDLEAYLKKNTVRND